MAAFPLFTLLLAVLLSLASSVEAFGTLFGDNNSKSPVVGRVSAGPTANGLEISSMGCGTWSWGNRFLFDYDPSQDEEIYEAYREVRNAGVTLFDTADSYGTLDLNGRAEILLGSFERRYLDEIGMGIGNDKDKSPTPWWNLGEKNNKSQNKFRFH